MGCTLFVINFYDILHLGVEVIIERSLERYRVVGLVTGYIRFPELIKQLF